MVNVIKSNLIPVKNTCIVRVLESYYHHLFKSVDIDKVLNALKIGENPFLFFFIRKLAISTRLRAKGVWVKKLKD